MDSAQGNWRVAAIRLGVIAACFAVINYIGDRLDWVRSESVPVKLAWISGGEVHKGDYVLFTAQHPIINGGVPTHLTKQVACVAGDRLHFDGSTWYCNGEVLGGVIRSTSDGKPIDVAQAEGVIPAGMLFLMGTHPRSFDSRYLGLIEEKRVTKVKALL
mgnify:CR=1 FL=1